MIFYAYVYSDPRDGLPFYVGKGQGQRARKHLVQTTNKGMAARLAALRDQGLEPEISTYGCDSEAHAFELERVLIEAYGRLCDGSGTLVNILEAGERSGGFAGRRHSEESKARIRAALTGRKRTPEQLENYRRAAVGRTLPVDAHAKAAEWSKSPEGRAQRARQAREMGPAHQARMTEAARAVTLGTPKSHEHRAKIGTTQKGRVFSDETRAKMSAAQRRRYAK